MPQSLEYIHPCVTPTHLSSSRNLWLIFFTNIGEGKKKKRGYQLSLLEQDSIPFFMHIEDVYRSGVTRRVTQFVKYAARWCMVLFSSFLLVLLIFQAIHLCKITIFSTIAFSPRAYQFVYWSLYNETELWNYDLQQFKPGYTAPPPLFEMGRIPMNFRGNWEISRRNLDSPSYIAMVSSNRNIADSDYDEFSASAATSVLCCHSVAIIFMVLLVLRHSLPLIFNESGDYSFPLLLSICLRTFGIFLPIYVMFKVVSAVHRRRLLLATSSSSPISSSSIARTSISQSPQPQPYIIRVR